MEVRGGDTYIDTSFRQNEQLEVLADNNLK